MRVNKDTQWPRGGMHRRDINHWQRAGEMDVGVLISHGRVLWGVIRCGMDGGVVIEFRNFSCAVEVWQGKPYPKCGFGRRGRMWYWALKTWFFAGSKTGICPTCLFRRRTDCPNPLLSELLWTVNTIQKTQLNHNQRRPRFPRFPQFGCFLGWSIPPQPLHHQQQTHCQLLSYPAVPSRPPSRLSISSPSVIVSLVLDLDKKTPCR